MAKTRKSASSYEQRIKQKLLAKSKNTRAAYLPKRNNINSESNEKELLFCPNFQIRENKIVYNEKLPQKEEIIEDSKIWRIDSTSDVNFEEAFKNITDEKIKPVFQLIRVMEISNKGDSKKYFSSTSCTISLIEINNRVFGVSVFHVLNKKKSQKVLNQKFFIHNDQNGIEKIAESLDQLMRIYKIENLEKVQEIIYNITQIKLQEIQLNMEFLYARKIYLEKMKNNSELVKDILLDPMFELQPLPSIDFCLFNVDLEKLDSQIKPLKIATKKISDYGIMIGFFQNDGVISKSGKEYCFSDFPEETDIYLKDFVHSDKSAGIVKIANENTGLFLFYGTTTEGSSGSPILTPDGDVYAITFGNFCDKEGRGEYPKEDIQTFDVEFKENKQSYELQKNVNLAIKINHPVFKEYFSNIEKMNTSNLNESSVMFFNQSLNSDIESRNPSQELKFNNFPDTDESKNKKGFISKKRNRKLKKDK